MSLKLKQKDTCMKRAMDLLYTKVRDLPPLALAARFKLEQKFSLCGEVCLTAFAAYAQVIEGHYCDDENYTARPDMIEFLKTHQGLATFKRWQDACIFFGVPYKE